MHLRFVGERLSRKWGQQVIVDIKAGAGATLAAAQMPNVKPDGYTIACMTINSLRYPHYQQASWHPLRDFSYIIGLSEFTFGVVVKADAPHKTIGDLIQAGKREPEKLNCGTSGIGGTGHLLMIETEQATGARFTHIPYKGGAEWMPALLGGHIQFVPDGAARRGQGGDRRSRPPAASRPVHPGAAVSRPGGLLCLRGEILRRREAVLIKAGLAEA